MTPSHPIRRAWRAAALTGALAVAVGACSAAGATPSPSAAVDAPLGDCPTSQPEPLPAGETRSVTITTDLGEIVIGLEADLSPIAVGNFAALAACDYYDGIVFHRVVPGFVIQGGDPTGSGSGGPGYTITDEPVTAVYARGTVAMARTSQPNSVGSQFFIVLDDSAAGALSSYNTYQIIGAVTSGMETADAIADAADAEIPSDPVVMTDVSVSSP
jgi:cyclophilin family peptidyl-prolyl cis-trans isomerase